MAAARQEQGNVMLYTAITFVGLFVISAILAVIFYIKSEDWRNQFVTSQQQMEEFATTPEVQNQGTIIGQKDRQTSRVKQLIGYLDTLYKISTGSEPQETSAEVKFGELETKYKDIVAALPKDFVIIAEANDTNGPGIFRIVEMYNNKLNQKDELISQLHTQLNDLGSEFDTAKNGAAEREAQLLVQLRTIRQDANSVQQSYNQLRDLMDKKATEQVQALMQQRDEAITEKNKTRQELLETMSKLSITQNRLQDSLEKLDVLKPRPKEDIAAYKPDGHIISIDIASNIVFIDIGSNARIYPGLTFSVYDRNAPIPTDGTSKAEIEVFNVDKNTAMARINRSSKKNPISEGDIIINLIWDSTAVNSFVVAGDFDFDGNSEIDSDGATKVKQLIENWGGKVEDTVTIDTDFVILGNQPQVKKKPTLDEIELDPLATEKYEASLKASEKYQEVKTQAKDLFIPIFNLKRFLNFIGYESLATGKK
ncbi:MAG: hypothetical protein WC496_07510 [Phycisphaerae bacterium]|jgi:hypothetical protein